MIPLVPTTQQTAVPFSGGWNVAALLQDVFRAWIAHHQRLADLGLGGGDI